MKKFDKNAFTLNFSAYSDRTCLQKKLNPLIYPLGFSNCKTDKVGHEKMYTDQNTQL